MVTWQEGGHVRTRSYSRPPSTKQESRALCVCEHSTSRARSMFASMPSA